MTDGSWKSWRKSRQRSIQWQWTLTKRRGGTVPLNSSYNSFYWLVAPTIHTFTVYCTSKLTDTTIDVMQILARPYFMICATCLRIWCWNFSPNTRATILKHSHWTTTHRPVSLTKTSVLRLWTSRIKFQKLLPTKTCKLGKQNWLSKKNSRAPAILQCTTSTSFAMAFWPYSVFSGQSSLFSNSNWLELDWCASLHSMHHVSTLLQFCSQSSCRTVMRPRGAKITRFCTTPKDLPSKMIWLWLKSTDGRNLQLYSSSLLVRFTHTLSSLNTLLNRYMIQVKTHK